MKKEKKEKKDNKKNERPKIRLKQGLVNLIITAVVLLIIGVLAYKFIGLIEAFILVIGLALVLFIGYLLDKPKTKTKKRKVLKIILLIALSFMILSLLAACVFYIFPKWLNSGGEFC